MATSSLMAVGTLEEKALYPPLHLNGPAIKRRTLFFCGFPN